MQKYLNIGTLVHHVGFLRGAGYPSANLIATFGHFLIAWLSANLTLDRYLILIPVADGSTGLLVVSTP